MHRCSPSSFQPSLPFNQWDPETLCSWFDNIGEALLSCCTAATKCRKFETNIPRKGISGPQSQFPHSCVYERNIYSHDGSACSAGGNEAALFPEKEYINGIAVAVWCACLSQDGSSFCIWDQLWGLFNEHQ